MLNDLKELVDREPLSPFRIVLTSGSTYDVTSPHQVAMGQSQINYHYPRSDRWAVLRLNQIASFEVRADAHRDIPSRGGNGGVDTSRRRRLS